VDRPAEPLREDPGDDGRTAGDRGLHRARALDQHHADLLARPLLRRRRGVPARARAPGRRRRRSVQGRVRRVVLVSRVDTEADRRLAEAGNEKLQGRLAIANAKLAYRHFEQAFSGPRWEFLAGKGARKQRPLWASTSTKNPAYRDVIYVEELIGPDTVNTMPPETVEAFADHGEVRGDTVRDGVGKAERLLGTLREAGVDYEDVVETLEDEGVRKFTDSFDELLDGIRAKHRELVSA
jgi:transaldolase